MMLQRTTPDDSREAAVARLTPKERECLDRWLGHATAKEIALDLGITHHAVEKRLKSARAKLGVSSTLEAARLLAAVGGYGPTVSQSPEVAAPVGAGQESASPAAGRSRPRRRAATLVAGVLLMSLIALAALALGAQPAAVSPDQPKVMVINRRDGSASTSLSAALAGVFARMDKNGDKFIAGDELGAGNFQVSRTVIKAGEPSPAPVGTPIAGFDKDGDKRVSEAEFMAGMNMLTSRVR